MQHHCVLESGAHAKTSWQEVPTIRQQWSELHVVGVSHVGYQGDVVRKYGARMAVTVPTASDRQGRGRVDTNDHAIHRQRDAICGAERIQNVHVGRGVDNSVVASFEC